jgi:hypothetical protein
MIIILMVKKKQESYSLTLTRVSRTLLFFSAVLAVSIIIFDSGNLITREAVIDRWVLTTVVFVSAAIAWFMASLGGLEKPTLHASVIFLITLILIGAAGFMTYWERGMASSSTILYVLPLLVIATLKNRHALLTATALSAGTYALATVLYFNTYFNEGYRVQLWGNIVLYTGIILVCGWLIMILTGLRHDSR